MTPAQCLLARQLLNWSRERLEAMSEASAHCIRIYELEGRIMPPGNRGAPDVDRVEAMRSALEAAGVEFTNGDAPGVMLRKPSG